MNRESEVPEVDVTVAILVYNGARYLSQILDALRSQAFGGTFEVLVIDSGSTDGSIDILSHYPEVRLHQIPNSEFGHGRTRNLAAQIARGAIVAYLTHDAIPADEHWLDELVAPFGLSDRVAAVMGCQIPRDNAFPLLKYEIKAVFDGFGPRFGTTLFYDDSFISSDAVRNAVTFYSDVNCAARRTVLTNEVPYRDVSYAEDQLFGRDLIAAGFVKAYAPRAAVVHSNDMTVREYDDRMFDETQGLREVGIAVAVPSLPLVARLVTVGVLKDSVRIVRDGGLSGRSKVKGLILNPAYHVQKWRGVRRGALTPVQRICSGS